MTTFLIAFVVFALAIAGLAIGVIISNKRITGSCGGLNLIDGQNQCTVCGAPVREDDRLRGRIGACGREQV